MQNCVILEPDSREPVKYYLSLLLYFLAACAALQAQDAFKFRPVTDIIVSDENGILPLAWAGGLNSAQYNTLDLNNDGRLDLVLYDRTTDKINTFVNTGSEYLYQPQYEYLFPENLNSWIVLADYDCDGRKDLFANTTFGVKVYKNVFDDQLNFQLQADPLLTESGSLLINLQVSASDIPAITDVDGDGDVDILIFNFATGGGVEYHQNQSMETDGTCTNLTFRQVTSSWGNFQECNCGVYAFGEDCADLGGRQAHAGGKSMLAFDDDADGDLELIFGDEFCNNIAFLKNIGDATDALFTDAILDYPQVAAPVNFFIFPALYLEDVTFDGRKDLIAAPNLFENLGRMVNFNQSSQLYQNDGLTGSESFTFQQDDWLQEDMMDFGEAAVPLFLDFDGDGDNDIIAGSRGSLDGATFLASFQLWENTGTQNDPQFEIADRDYLGLSTLQLQSLKPTYADLNADGRSDLIFSAAAGSGQTNIYYYLNNNALGFSPQSSSPEILNFTIQSGDFPFFKDLDNDGSADILVGKRTGRLEFWRNLGEASPFSFELVTDEVAGIGDDSFRRELVPVAADLNGDGVLELTTLDATGVMRIYSNFLSNTEGALPQVFDLVLQPTSDQSTIQSRWGRGASITQATLDDGLPHLIVGSNQGGFYLLENFSDPLVGPGPGQGIALQLFPNPADDIVEIRANQTFHWSLYNNLGQLILQGPESGSSNRYLFDGSNLKDGVYLLRGSSTSGISETRRLLIIH